MTQTKDIWLDNVNIIPSPNFNERPSNIDIDLLVIHSISLPPGKYENNCVVDFFQNKLNSSQHPYFQQISDLKVSAHLFIKRDGQVIQFVALNKRAWHAGLSHFEGRDQCNDFSIGIELEGTDQTHFTEKQYESLIATTQAITSIYPHISKDRIVGHSDIAPGRKTDPGTKFDWNLLLQAFD